MGTSARTRFRGPDGTHSECPRETDPQNYFHHAFHEDAKPGDLTGRHGGLPSPKLGLVGFDDAL